MEMEREITQLRLENTQLKMKIEELNKKPISKLLYVKSNYTNAPVLEPIHGCQIVEFTQQYNQNQIHIHIGDFIIKNYIKNNQREQSVWNSNKFNFIIRENDNDVLGWKIDINGVKFNKIVIEPIIQNVRKQMIEYIQNFYNERRHTNAYEHDMILGQIEKMCKTIVNIDNKIVTRKVLNYVAPHFCLNDNISIDETIYIQI